jgi:hypothetical protein
MKNFKNIYQPGYTVYKFEKKSNLGQAKGI